MKIQKLLHRKPIDQSGFSHVEIFIALVIIAIVAVVGVRVLNGSHAATNCDPNANLVNPCRPWVGAAVDGYSQAAGDKASQFTYADKRLNNANVLTNPSASTTLTNKLDVVHIYHPVGSNSLSSFEVATAKTPGKILIANYKPSDDWASASGGNATVNAHIKQMADSIKAIGSAKIMLAIYHEPENNVSSGNCTTSKKDAHSGSPTDYVNMWHNTRKIFDSEGVTNVVWVMNYMGYSGWDCLAKPMWPGNSYVDWLVWDNYGHGSTLFSASVQHAYDNFTNSSDATHDFLSKPWGLGEFGYGNSNGDSTQANAISYWNDAQNAITNNKFPKFKLYDVFDTSTNGNSQVGLDFSNNPSVLEQTAYNNWAKTIFNLSTPPPPGDTTAPVVSITSPAANSSVNGIATINVTATDNKAVTRVVIKWDGNVIRDATSQGTYGWGSQWNTANAPNGTHTLTATAYDAAGNTKSTSVVVKVANGDSSAPVVSITHPSAGDKVSGVIVVNVTATDNVAVTRVVVKWDDTVIRDNTVTGPYGWGSAWNTSTAPNGYHLLTATAYDANGNTTVSTSVKVNVQN